VEAITIESRSERQLRLSGRVAQQKKYFKIGVFSSISIIALLVLYYLYAPSSFIYLLGFIFIFNLLSIIGLVYFIRIFLRNKH